MKKAQEQSNQYGVDLKKSEYQLYLRSNPSEGQLQQVQSIIQINTQLLSNSDHDDLSRIMNKKNYSNQNTYEFNKYNESRKQGKELCPINVQSKSNKRKLQTFQQRFSKYPISKSNSQTNIISSIPSLQYISSQEPSFSNKGQFTVLEDFNLQYHYPSISDSNHNKHFQQKQNKQKDWEIDSFEAKVMKNFALKEKCIKVLQFIQQLRLMKQNFWSKLKEEKSRFINELQEVKKILFQLNIQCDKQMIEFTKNNVQQPKFSSSHISTQPKQKYEQGQCQKCMKLQLILQTYDQQQQNWKNHFIESQQKDKEEIMKISEEMLKLQQQFNFLEKSKIEIERKLKQKQKQILYQQSQCQYRLRNIQKRQRQLQVAQQILKRQKDEFQIKKQKIADYEFKIRRQERKQKNQVKDKQCLSSEYFTNNDNKSRIISKIRKNFERSDSVSSIGSRIDINARLKEIQMIKAKTKGQGDYEDRITSKNSSKDSLYFGLKQYSSPRVSGRSRNMKDYGIRLQSSGNNQNKRQSSHSIKLSEKLNKLTETLQNQLKQIS